MSCSQTCSKEGAEERLSRHGHAGASRGAALQRAAVPHSRPALHLNEQPRPAMHGADDVVQVERVRPDGNLISRLGMRRLRLAGLRARKPLPAVPGFDCKFAAHWRRERGASNDLA